MGTWSGETAGEVVGEVPEVVGGIAEVVGEIAKVVGEVTEVPTLAWSHLRHDVSMALSELNRG